MADDIARSPKTSLREEGFLTCGQFAKLCHVKKQTLFHYDDIGLLSPQIVSENGYRFYSYKQFEVYSIISSLKEAGLSLAEIKDFLTRRDSAARLETLREARRTIEQKITHLREIDNALFIEVDRAEEAQSLFTNEIQVIQLESVELVRSVDLAFLNDNELIDAVRQFSSTVEVVCAALDTNVLRERDWEHYRFLLAFPPALPREQLAYLSARGPKLLTYIRPAGSYAVAYHQGPFSQAGHVYDRLLAYCDERGLALGHYAYEEYLRNELTAASPQDCLTRISVQVQPAKTQPANQMRAAKVQINDDAD